ncbi:cell wall assembly regulator SMI1 [Saccharothrix ecbatanensis]|uniref:Cell wall assembly regulator SMI1 n=1 Tax=Saccharothrix ecbatanensis TaxID=1105145 RepID=A0A7W9HGW1_9PSEU|nr:SMI1/KNR4 family protein [Saccharothrix ecbatanensis]MBB5802052.1 cell wall assembly regulator SMI1 [Saccharothrix ecbatanensis]
MDDHLEVLVGELMRMARGTLGPERAGTWQIHVPDRSIPHFRTWPDGGLQIPEAHTEPFSQLLQALDKALRAPGDDRTLVLEVSGDSHGGTEFRHLFTPAPATLDTVVLDPDYRHPNHPLQGMPRPAAARPTGEPTDPEVLRHVGALVTRFTDHYRRQTGRAPEFGTPSTEAELAAAEDEMGLRLPEDVRALYRVIGDDMRESRLLGPFNLLPLPRVVSTYLVSDYPGDTLGAWGWTEELFALSRVVLESDPPGAVRDVSRNDWWVVIAEDFAGNACAVDLDPGPAGRSGQLIVHGADYFGPVGHIAESLTARLEAVVSKLDAGDVEWDGRPRMSLPDGPAEHGATVLIEDRDLADLLAEIPHRDTVQELFLAEGRTLDLRALTATPRVRALFVNGADSVDLRLPESVQCLDLNVREADLSVLRGHPKLWDLTVKGLPVTISDLAGLPSLSYLDLSEADVDDVGALADLDVRALTLNPDQWLRLQAAGRLPKRLAGARRTGRPGITEFTDWSRWLSNADH